MPHSIIDDAESGCLFVRFDGKLTLDEITDVIDLLISEPTYRAYYRRFHDYRLAEGTLSTAELKSLVQHSRKTRASLTQVEQVERRTAVLLGSRLNFGLGRMAEVFGESPGGRAASDFRVFREYAEAAEYLALPSADYDPFERDATDARPEPVRGAERTCLFPVIIRDLC